MSTFYLEVFTPNKLFFSGNAEKIVFPIYDGQYEVLPNHEYVITVIAAGEMKYAVDGKWNFAAIGDGYVEITPDRVILMTDFAELPEEIDLSRANSAKERAEERLRQNQSQIEYLQSKTALARSMARIKVKKHME